MRQFIHSENIKHYKLVLEHTTDEAERRRILNLMAEEEAADLEPGTAGDQGKRTEPRSA